MFWFKACPKCHGDLYMETDVYGSYIACLQCSRYLTNEEDAQLNLSGPEVALLPALIEKMEQVAA